METERKSRKGKKRGSIEKSTLSGPKDKQRKLEEKPKSYMLLHSVVRIPSLDPEEPKPICTVDRDWFTAGRKDKLYAKAKDILTTAYWDLLEFNENRNPTEPTRYLELERCFGEFYNDMSDSDAIWAIDQTIKSLDSEEKRTALLRDIGEKWQEDADDEEGIELWVHDGSIGGSSNILETVQELWYTDRMKSLLEDRLTLEEAQLKSDM